MVRENDNSGQGKKGIQFSWDPRLDVIYGSLFNMCRCLQPQCCTSLCRLSLCALCREELSIDPYPVFI